MLRAVVFFSLLLATYGGIPLSCLCPTPGVPTHCPTGPNQCITNLYIVQYFYTLKSYCSSATKPPQCNAACSAIHYAETKMATPPKDQIHYFPDEYQGSWANFFVMIISSLPGSQPGEIAYVINGLTEQYKALPHQTSDTVYPLWAKAWSARADAIFSDGMRLRRLGQAISAQENFNRAFLYYFAAQWPTPTTTVDLEAKAVHSFQLAYPEAQPFMAGGLQAYYTPTTVAPKGERRPLVVITTGLDGPKEIIWVQNGIAALKRGYNVIVFDGPGQGTSTRQTSNPDIWKFRPDWENVTTTIIDTAYTIPEIQDAVDWNNVILMGLSLGGYLNGRSCAYSQPTLWNISACVLDTGVVSGSQLVGDGFVSGILGGAVGVATNMTTQKLIPSDYLPILADAYTKWYVPTINCSRGRAQLEHLFSTIDVLDPDSLYLAYKFAGDHGTNYTELAISAIEGAYNALPFVNKRIAEQRMPTLVFGGTEDYIAGGQVHDYFNQLPHNPLNKLIVYNSTSGAALHCQVGAFAVWEEATFEFLDRVLYPSSN